MLANRMMCVAVLAAAFCTPALGAGPRSAAALLADASVAAGIGRDTAPGALRSTGTEAADGLQGRWTLDEDMATGRFAERSDFAVFRVADVFDGKERWRQDRSGGVHALDGAFSRRRVQTEAWLTRRGYLRLGVDEATFGPVDDREENGHRFETVTATPNGGVPVELWFDADSHLLDRSVMRMPLDTLTRRYADYRRVGSMRLPFRIVSEEGGSEDIVTIAMRDIVDPVPGGFARPARPADTTLRAPTSLPVEIEDDVIVEARLNGQGPFSFILDTGGHAILTPAAVARLGLTAVGAGQSGGAGEGTLAQQDVRIATMSIGDARFVDQHFYVLPLQASTTDRGSRPPLAGLLGIELFERLAVRIDHRHGRLTLAPFAQADGLCRGTVLPIAFDDDMPLVDGRIDGAAGVIAVDTGNGSSTVVQGVWAAANGLAATMKHGVEAVSLGSGGESRNWVSHGHRLDLGPLSLTDLEVRYAEDRKGAFSSVTEAANIGHQVLSNFAVTFDVSRRRMCLEPGDRSATPAFNRAGLGLAKTDDGRFRVVQVRPGSPAAAAGLRVGDVVAAVDGRAAAELSAHDIAVAVRRAPGTRMRVHVVRGGVDSDLELRLAEPS